MQSNRGLALKMLASLGRWQLHLMAELRELKARTPIERLSAYLLELADAEGGEAVIKLPYPKNVIASRIGITSESLSRVLARLAELGVRTEGNTLTIADVAAFRRSMALPERVDPLEHDRLK
jgi:CRP-like cAMP-binding protein